MQQRGIPIDGGGMESHWALLVRISELDARLLLPASAADLATPADISATI